MNGRLTLTVLLGCSLGFAQTPLADVVWESIGPDKGFGDLDEFYVTDNALYIGQSEGLESGLGLFRRGFDFGEWELLAFEGYKVVGIVVWGNDDENLLVRTWDGTNPAETWRSIDGGNSWSLAGDGLESGAGILKAVGDSDRMISGRFYSTDAGWTWREGIAYQNSYVLGQCFHPSTDLVAYMTIGTGGETYEIWKTANGGPVWASVLVGYERLVGIALDRGNGERVMVGRAEDYVRVSSNGGVSWTAVTTPFRPKEMSSPPWGLGFFGAGSDTDDALYGLQWTGDLGQTWTDLGDGLPSLPETLWLSWIRIQAHPVDPVLYVALEPTGVWRLDLSGVSGIDGSQLEQAGAKLITYPNPSSGEVTITFRGHAAPSLRSIRVIDVMGRVVSSLDAGLGETTLRWDGRDRQGREVASGVYRVMYFRPDGGIGGSERVLILR
jgi:hypothetical protein